MDEPKLLELKDLERRKKKPEPERLFSRILKEGITTVTDGGAAGGNQYA